MIPYCFLSDVNHFVSRRLAQFFGYRENFDSGSLSRQRRSLPVPYVRQCDHRSLAAMGCVL